MTAQSGAGQSDQQMGALMAELSSAAASGDYDRVDQINRQLAGLSERKNAKSPAPDQVPSALQAPVTTTPAIADTRKRSRGMKSAPPAREPQHLPVWAERHRGIPNELVRSALFSVTASPRRQLRDQVIAGTAQRMITYSGEELRVTDEDVLLQIYHLARGTKLGEPFTVTAGDFLDRLGKTHGAKNYAELYKSLHRLSKGNVTITDVRDQGEYTLQSGPIISDLLIHHAALGQAKWIQITLSARTEELWNSMGYTLLDWQQRCKLSGPMGKALHRYFASHRDPYPIKVETIRRMMGSETSSITRFRQLLRQALDELVEIGFLTRYWIDSTDKVNVTRADASPGLLS